MKVERPWKHLGNYTEVMVPESGDLYQHEPPTTAKQIESARRYIIKHYGGSRHHRGKVSKDRDTDLWACVCDCSLTWNFTRWRDAFDAVFYHVRSQMRIQSQGIGFTSKRGKS